MAPTVNKTDVYDTRYSVTSVDLLAKVGIVAGPGAGKDAAKYAMPESITLLLRRAISAREKCTRWFEENAPWDVDENSSHCFFTGVLRAAAERIPAAPKSFEKDPASKDGTKAPRLENAFADLHVEEASDENVTVD